MQPPNLDYTVFMCMVLQAQQIYGSFPNDHKSIPKFFSNDFWCEKRSPYNQKSTVPGTSFGCRDEVNFDTSLSL